MYRQLDQFEDPDQQEYELTMSKTILAMPEEVQDRFKALKVLYVSTSHHNTALSTRIHLGPFCSPSERKEDLPAFIA